MRYILFLSIALVFCTCLTFAGNPPTDRPECNLCELTKMITPGSPFFQLAKSLHQENANALPGPHYYCVWSWYYNANSSNYTYWEKLPSSRWAVKFTPLNCCTVWNVNILFDIKKNSPINKQDTIEFFVQEAYAPYAQIFRQYYQVNPYNIEQYYNLYLPLGSPYSQGTPVINTKRDFLIAVRMRGPSTDSVRWTFKTPAINASRSLKFTTATTTITASQAIGNSVDFYYGAELCIHVPFNNCYIPVELAYFGAETHLDGIKLIWDTATETNNYGFYVQKSSSRDGPWEPVSFIQGKGNSTVKVSYSYEDKFDVASIFNSGQNSVWYRLRQIDFDGTTDDSKPLMVALMNTEPDGFELEQNYPNPFFAGSSGRPHTTIQFRVPYEQQVAIIIYDALGRQIQSLLNEKISAGIHQLLWDASSNTSGTYIVKMTADNYTKSQKMILSK